MWKHIVEAERPQLTIWRMRVARWIPNAALTQNKYTFELLLFR
jgi:hypothetical protein